MCEPNIIIGPQRNCALTSAIGPILMKKLLNKEVLLQNSQTSFLFKNVSHDTIYIFKNYFNTLFSIFNFQFLTKTSDI